MKCGKTTTVLAMRGKGQKTVLREMFRHDRRTFPLTSGSGETVSTHVQAQYIHLGGIVDREASMKAEARCRLALAAASFNRNRSLLLQNCFIETKVRGSLFRGLVSTTFYNLELWTEDFPSWNILSDGYCGLCRRLLLPRADFETVTHLTIEEVMFRAGQAPIEILARAKRLVFLCGLVRKNSVGNPTMEGDLG